MGAQARRSVWRANKVPRARVRTRRGASSLFGGQYGSLRQRFRFRRLPGRYHPDGARVRREDEGHGSRYGARLRVLLRRAGTTTPTCISTLPSISTRRATAASYSSSPSPASTRAHVSVAFQGDYLVLSAKAAGRGDAGTRAASRGAASGRGISSGRNTVCPPMTTRRTRPRRSSRTASSP